MTNDDASTTTPSNDRDRPVLQVIVGSTRPGRIGRSFAEWIERIATDHGDFTVEMVDLADVALPFSTSRTTRAWRNTPTNTPETGAPPSLALMPSFSSRPSTTTATTRC
jgi:hypothetical protein